MIADEKKIIGGTRGLEEDRDRRALVFGKSQKDAGVPSIDHEKQETRGHDKATNTSRRVACKTAKKKKRERPGSLGRELELTRRSGLMVSFVKVI